MDRGRGRGRDSGRPTRRDSGRPGVGSFTSTPGGRSSGSSSHSTNSQQRVGSCGSTSGVVPQRNKGGWSHMGRQTSANLCKQFDMSTLDDLNQHCSPTPGSGNIHPLQNSWQKESVPVVSSGIGGDSHSLHDQYDLKDLHTIEMRNHWELRQHAGKEISSSGCSPALDASCYTNESLVEVLCGTGVEVLNKETRKDFNVKEVRDDFNRIPGYKNRSGSDEQQRSVPFDIAPEKIGNFVTLKTPLHLKNRAKRNDTKHNTEGKNITLLMPGMFLLKRYISIEDQVKLVKICRELGMGPGGFYQPAYRDGAQLHLKMMCLGKNWDPETSIYSDRRPSDGAKPPQLPTEFGQLVKEAISDSHAYLQKHLKARKVEDTFPPMAPDICIVNFYSKSGRLGLHQDKDESPESLRRGLPVVSFSIGDSAEFLYSEKRDADSAEKVILESGDVLIFGGKSRLVYHGVTTILSDTAPKALLEETNLRPGRLNLTLREY